MKYLCVLSVLATMLAWCMPAMADDEMPKDAQWAIFCRSFSGPMRVQEAKINRDAVEKSSGLKYFHVIHLTEESTLYYGYYRNVTQDIDDAALKKDADRAHKDLEKLRNLTDAEGHKVFELVGFVPLPEPGSEGPAEWDLSKLPADKYWTLYVGVYKDNPDRKKAAVAAVKALRDDGKEAYYYHSTTASMICLGAWPRNAVKEQQSDEASVDVNDPDYQVMAVNVPLPDNVPREFNTPDGKKVRLFAPKVDVADPTLQRAMDLYPDFLTNGKWLGKEVRDPKTGKNKVVGHKSQLFMIPRKGHEDGEPTREMQRAVRELQPTPAKQPAGTGTLRRLQESQ